MAEQPKPFNQRVYEGYVQPFVDRVLTPAIDAVGYYVPPGTRKQVAGLADLFATPDTVTPTRNALAALGEGRYGLAATEGANALLAPLMITPMAPELLAMRAAAAGPRMSNMLARRPAASAPEPPGITAYHGSPHDFDAFDMSRIGTGEGAQAYGHGLYFAENQSVARNYRDSLSADGLGVVARGRLRQHNGDIDKTIAYMRSRNVPHEAEALAELEKAKAAGVNSGRLYGVRIKAKPDQFLDWDKPRDSLSPKLQEWAQKSYPAQWSQAADGSSLYQLIERAVEREAGPGAASRRVVTQEMRDAGIPGIRYLDQGSRGTGVGTYNYVVFDDGLIQIVSKDGKLIPQPSPNPSARGPVMPQQVPQPGLTYNALAAGVLPSYDGGR